MEEREPGATRARDRGRQVEDEDGSHRADLDATAGDLEMRRTGPDGEEFGPDAFVFGNEGGDG